MKQRPRLRASSRSRTMPSQRGMAECAHRDSAFASDAAKINVTEIFKSLSPGTRVQVL